MGAQVAEVGAGLIYSLSGTLGADGKAAKKTMSTDVVTGVGGAERTAHRAAIVSSYKAICDKPVVEGQTMSFIPAPMVQAVTYSSVSCGFFARGSAWVGAPGTDGAR